MDRICRLLKILKGELMIITVNSLKATELVSYDYEMEEVEGWQFLLCPVF